MDQLTACNFLYMPPQIWLLCYVLGNTQAMQQEIANLWLELALTETEQSLETFLAQHRAVWEGGNHDDHSNR